MSDQNTAPEQEAANTPTDSPDDGAGQQENWQKRFEDTQAAYTQGQQELAQLRQQVQQHADPEHRAQLFQELAQELGYQIQDDDTDDFVDPYARLEERLNQQEQYLAAQQQTQQQEQALDYLDQVVESELGKLPDDLPKKAKDWITSRALAMDAVQDPHGHPVPDIQGAFREFNDGLVNDLKKSWANTKRAPHVSANGQAGTQTKNVDDMTLEELEQWQVQRLADLSAD